MPIGISRASDTSHSEAGRPSGCPCGRYHPTNRPYKLKRGTLADHDELRDRVYDAWSAGLAENSGDRWLVRYSGKCSKPIPIKRSASSGALFATMLVRCWKCDDCRRAIAYYWAMAGKEQTRLAAERGDRTWFGTLTFRSEHQRAMIDLARDRWMAETATGSAPPDWWEDALCDERFRLVREEVVAELQMYWKRLRKAGHKFTYLAVLERHKTGLPHVHFLLHEKCCKIRKRDLQEKWPFGFSNVSIVGGKARKSAAPEKADFPAG